MSKDALEIIDAVETEINNSRSQILCSQCGSMNLESDIWYDGLSETHPYEIHITCNDCGAITSLGRTITASRSTTIMRSDFTKYNGDDNG